MKKIIALLAVLMLVACAPVRMQPPAQPAPAQTAPEVMPPAETPAEAAPEVMPEAKGVEVAIEGFKFNPASLVVKVGETVTWTNKDTAPHTVTIISGVGETFDSGQLETGQTFSHTFSVAGAYPYKCSLHPGMRGSVIVK